MRKKLYSILIFLIVTSRCLVTYGQEPTSFVIGEKDLINTDVYSICQTDDELLYIGTNNGLFVYKHGQFQQIPGAKEQQGNSLFDLKLDNKGDLFCGNLGGQIFKLTDGQLELFYAFGSDKANLNLMYAFDSNNHLIVVTSIGCLDVFEGEKKVLLKPERGIFSLNKLLDGRIIIETDSPDSIIYVKDGILNSIIVARRNLKEEYSPYTNRTQSLGNNLFSIYGSGRIECLDSKNLNCAIPEIRNERYFQFDKNVIWALDHANGLRKISLDEKKAISSSNKYYAHQFISSITQGKNGTLFLGTFGKGIIVVPNESIQRHIIERTDMNIKGIAVNKNNDVFLSTRDGRVLLYNQKTTLIESLPGVSMDHVFYLEGIDFGINKAYPSIVYDGRPWNGSNFPLGSVKDVCQVDDSSALIVTSIGVYKIGEVMEGEAWEQMDSPYLNRLSALKERCKSVTYDTQNELLFVATTYGLNKVTSSNHKDQILYNNESILCNDLLFHNNQLWCATLKYGILIFENGILSKKIDELSGLGDNAVSKIEIQKDRLFVSHKNGFQILDLKSNKWTTLGTAEGIINGSVHDFALSQDKLWLLSNGQPLSLNLNDLPRKKPDFSIHLDSIVVSNERIDTAVKTFSYSQNQFSFYTDFRGIEYESEAMLHYKLNGFDADWNTTASTAALIEYKYLPPGDYTFEIKTHYRDLDSKMHSYSFQITPPYWQRLWFYLIIGTLLVLLLISLYRYQIHRIDKKNKEKLEKQKIQTDLFESELKALRSQMNPHFIFNSLNSIQDLILQQDTNSAYDYIVLFADLVRRTLNYSNKGFIAIEKELEFLEVYLSLEKLRFGEDFNYEISYKGSKEVNVPSLIAQPFIENALVHGLLHQSGQKKLTIEFNYSDKLTCTITDNGVGRKRAKEIQERRGNHHESFALDAIEKRLSILGEQHSEEVGYRVFDLYEGDSPSGTKVVITMPYQDQF
ncbi:MAG: hypothetical protein ACI8ZM_000415 [Crocinitomix sp.]